MKKYFAYVRVSTTRQGEQGVSLKEQREAVDRFTNAGSMKVTEWFEEQETAAKQGRPVFNQMLKRLKNGEADGVIMHKIDRSARNLRDWAEVGLLIDQGIEVHFANEALDLSSRGGRLSADIQAVVAADFIRNLREETKKGFYGRLKQGLLPRPAPLGYLNQGKGNPKTIDPEKGPLVRQAFELYATGRYGLNGLVQEMYILGLRGRRGKIVSRNGIARMLANPFYIGLIKIKKAGETYLGVHEPLVPKLVFDRVQQTLLGKRVRGNGRHTFLFSRLIQCKHCNRSLIAEGHKNRTYYRCHTQGCPSTIFREDRIDETVRLLLKSFSLCPEEAELLDQHAAEMKERYVAQSQTLLEQLRFREKALFDRQNRLTDAYLEGTLEKSEYGQRKTTLVTERRDIEDMLQDLGRGNIKRFALLDKYVDLTKRAYLLYENGIFSEQRDLLQETLLTRRANGKSLEFTLRKRLSEVATRPLCSSGSPHRIECLRFWQSWIQQILDEPSGN